MAIFEYNREPINPKDFSINQSSYIYYNDKSLNEPVIIKEGSKEYKKCLKIIANLQQKGEDDARYI